ncbi:Group II intron maturase [Streptococcus pneumoniae]|nr:Group II intron maturase [Streptococcus pneumoniae]
MNNNFNNFNNMDDLFNQLMGGMRGYSSENRRYLINGREVTPEEFAHYRATGQLPGNAETDVQMPQQASGMKQDGVLAKLGRNLTAEAREGDRTDEVSSKHGFEVVDKEKLMWFEEVFEECKKILVS